MTKQKAIESNKDQLNVSRRALIKKAAISGAVLAAAPIAAPYINANTKAKLVIQTRPGRFTKLEKMKSSFIAKFPDADIEFIALAGVDHEDTISKTLAQIAAGKQIDLQRVATEGIQLYAGAGYIQSLDKWVKETLI